MKLLLHTCCAPCSVYCIDNLRKEEIEPTIYWYNPNIHPYTEYKARRDTLKEYTEMIEIKAIFEEEYGLKEFEDFIRNSELTMAKIKIKNPDNPAILNGAYIITYSK